MSIIKPDDIPFSWIKTELKFKSVLRNGARGKRVRFVQESLTLQGYPLVCDGAFGPATERVVQDYQSRHGLSESGRVTRETFEKITEPYLRAFSPIASSKPFSEIVVQYARQHLKEHPREVGGQNKGPWVRFYMGGNDGAEWLWCAGFVTLLVSQASKQNGHPLAVRRTYSCDVLAERAKNDGQFVSERDVDHANDPADVILPGSLFLSRRTRYDWTHTGLVVEANNNTFTTIEGNTNDEGSREGYEVCARTRNYSKKDFIVY